MQSSPVGAMLLQHWANPDRMVWESWLEANYVLAKAITMTRSGATDASIVKMLRRFGIVAVKPPAKERAKTVNANPKKTAIQNDADEFLRAVRRLLKASANPPRSDPSYIHVSTLRTLERCVRGLEGAKSDPELSAEMEVALELLRQLLGLGCAVSEIGHMARMAELLELIEELEAIRKRERE